MAQQQISLLPFLKTRHGEVVECGQAHQIFNNPAQERTRAYLEGQF